MTAQRNVVNSVELERELKNLGFYIFKGDESFEEQVWLFRDADIIAGPHGGAFFNCLFCNKDCKILEFTPRGRNVTMWRNQSFMIENKNHQIIQCDDDINNNHKIDIELIKHPGIDPRFYE